eukprot:6317768-Amphidinium_carterae.1
MAFNFKGYPHRHLLILLVLDCRPTKSDKAIFDFVVNFRLLFSFTSRSDIRNEHFTGPNATGSIFPECRGLEVDNVVLR